MNTYKVLKSQHTYGVKDGKNWSLLTVVIDLPRGGVASLKFWGKDPVQAPKAGDEIFIKYELFANQERVYGKPVDFDKA